MCNISLDRGFVFRDRAADQAAQDALFEASLDPESPFFIFLFAFTEK